MQTTVLVESYQEEGRVDVRGQGATLQVIWDRQDLTGFEEAFDGY